MAENLARLGGAVCLVSRVGDDDSGRSVLAHLVALGVDTSMVSTALRPTASYTAILQPDGELVLGLADMDLYDELTPALIDLTRLRGLAAAAIAVESDTTVADNLTVELLHARLAANRA